MAGKVVNGGRLAYIYTATNGTTPTVGTTPVLTLTDQVSTNVAFDDSGNPVITIDSTASDETIYDFRRTYCTSTAVGGTPEDITYEDGATVLGASQTGTTLYIVIGGGTVQGGSSAGKKQVFHGFVAPNKSIGSWTQQGNTFNRPALTFTGLAAEGTITIASTYFSSVMTTAASQTLNTTTKKLGDVFFG